MATTSAQVQQLYVAYLGRAADQGGLNYWLGELNATPAKITLDQIRANFVSSQPEYAAAYAGLTREATVTKIYNNLFGRAPDAGGLTYWTTGGGATVAIDQLQVAFINGASAADTIAINNKAFVAQTYTDTVGANYNGAAGVAVIAGVDGTVASVDTAISAINNGTLAGQVPALGLINTLAAAQAAEAAGQTANTAAVDALVAKLAANTTAGTDTDDILTAVNPTYANKIDAIVADAAAFRIEAGKNTAGVAEASTAVLQTRANEAATAVDTARAALPTAGDAKAKAAAYEAAITANAALKASDATAVAGVKAVLATDAGFTDTATTGVIAKVSALFPAGAGLPTIDVTSKVSAAASLYVAYTAATTTAETRAKVDAELKGVAYFDTFKATAAADIAKNTAAQAVVDTKSAIDLADGQTAGSAAEFSAILKAKTDAAATLVKAQAADADVAAVKAITDANKVLKDATDKAGTDITAFNNANTAAKAFAISTRDASATVKESFYFAAKVDATDFVIGSAAATTHFGAGDSIVLGSGYTYNAGALSTGNNNALEFFLVKSDAGVQVVVESTVAGSTNATVSATAGVTNTVAALDTNSVITLTGVTLDHVSVANGVVSYV